MITFFVALTFSLPLKGGEPYAYKQYDTAQAACEAVAHNGLDPLDGIIMVQYDQDGDTAACCEAIKVIGAEEFTVKACDASPADWDCNRPRHIVSQMDCVSSTQTSWKAVPR